MKEKFQINALQVITAVLVLVFLLSLLPILYASFYAHPVIDDFAFSASVHKAIRAGAGPFEVLSVSLKQVAETYIDWQGPFSITFISTFQPAVFSQDVYFVTAFVLLFALCFSTFFFIDTIIVKSFKASRTYSILISSVVLFCTCQFVINIPEAFFWWNAGIGYTFFYAMSLCFFAFIIRMYLAESSTKRKAFFACCLFFAFFIGGSNYSTTLCSFCVLALVLVYEVLNHKLNNKNTGSNIYKYVIIIFAVFLVSFAINFAAPGNAVRASNFEGYGPVEAIAASIWQSFKYIGSWTKLPQIIMFVFVSPILYDIAKKLDFDFKYPIVALVLAFLLYATQLTPPLYAMKMVGAGRQVNIYYYSYHLLVLFWIFYLSGYAAKRGLINVDTEALFKARCAVPATLLLTLLFVTGCLSYGLDNMCSKKVWNAIDSGEAWQYEVEYMELVEKVQNGEKYISDVQTCPANVFYRIQFSEGYEDAVAEYYGVEPFEVIPLT